MRPIHLWLASLAVLLGCAPSRTGGEDAGPGDAGRADAGGEDAGSAPRDAGEEPGTLSLGASAVAQRVYSTSPSTGSHTTAPVETRAGSLILVGVARGVWESAPSAPTDFYGNAYTTVEGPHPYAAFPDARTGLFAASDARGGAGHMWSAAWGDVGGTGDEVTLSAVEVRGARGIESASWIEREGAPSLTSEPVTTSGPALLLAWWWGTGRVLPEGSLHVAVPEGGFELVPGATGLRSLGTNGYIQVAVASRTVDAAGSYQVTWTGDGEGAQLYLVAVR
jgi:hypothetical protein